MLGDGERFRFNGGNEIGYRCGCDASDVADRFGCLEAAYLGVRAAFGICRECQGRSKTRTLSFAGVAPFDELKPVKEIHQPPSRNCQDLEGDRTTVPCDGGQPVVDKKAPARASRGARAQKDPAESH
jgi:hypothetical protein